MATDGRHVDGHRQVLVALSPFLRNVLDAPEVDQVILPDFRMAEIRSLMNFIYTGR